jgi:hypothetical protein
MNEAEELRRIASEGRLDLFSPASVAAVTRLNARLIAALIEEAAEARATKRPPAARIGDLLVRIRNRARTRLSEVPVSLLDAGFGLDVRWQELAGGQRPATPHLTHAVSGGHFQRERAMRLAYELFDTAVTAARAGIPNAILLPQWRASLQGSTARRCCGCVSTALIGFTRAGRTTLRNGSGSSSPRAFRRRMVPCHRCGIGCWQGIFLT